MNENNNSQDQNNQINSDPNNFSTQPLTDVQEATPALKKPFRPTKIQIAIFVAVFGGIAGYILWRSFAAPLTGEAQLLSAFNNFASQKPKTVSGQAVLNSKSGKRTHQAGSLDFNFVSGNYGSFEVSGSVQASGKNFPFDYIQTGDGRYFKLNNLTNLQSVAGKSSPVNQYLTQHSSDIAKINDKWIALDAKPASAPASSSAVQSCLINGWPKLTSVDNTRLTTNYLLNPPFKVNSTKSVDLADEKGTEIALTVKNISSSDSFYDRSSTVAFINQINSCAQKYGAPSGVSTGRQALNRNSILAWVYLDKNHRIKKIVVQTDSSSTSSKVTLSFGYGAPTKIVAPASAQYMPDTINALISTPASSHDQKTIQDLNSLITSINQYTDRGKGMPKALKDLGTLKLNYNISSYTYSPTTLNAAGYNYNVCATFMETQLNGQNKNSFNYHKQGLQCYTNAVYKGDSHISAI